MKFFQSVLQFFSSTVGVLSIFYSRGHAGRIGDVALVSPQIIIITQEFSSAVVSLEIITSQITRIPDIEPSLQFQYSSKCSGNGVQTHSGAIPYI